MTDEKIEDVKSEVELGFCCKHPAFPVDHGMQEVEQQTPFGISKRKVRVMIQEFARCQGDMCEAFWCKVHNSCRDICEHYNTIHSNEEISQVFEIFTEVLSRRGMASEIIAKVIKEVQKELDGEEVVGEVKE